MLPELDNSDWEEAFKYCGLPGEWDNGYDPEPPEPCAPGYEVDVAPFSRADVAEIVGQHEGEKDEDSWLVAGALKDGRWFFLSAWCDYTGWG